MQSMNDTITDILDTLEDLRGQDDLVAKLKALYPFSDEFIAYIIRFDQEIRKISSEKEVTHVMLKGEQEICKVFSINEKGYTIQASLVDIPRGIHQRVISAEQIARRLYDVNDQCPSCGGGLCSCGLCHNTRTNCKDFSTWCNNDN